ncbi:GPI ethanolamine phosphate transferase 1-like, partial [Diaphorina citri]|uniref:GPI ethanolamine phosphate transferase 1 n=1 Tax=Diaphorina citri TaxID=121845 RepID=A0A3Q0J9L9_DIACI
MFTRGFKQNVKERMHFEFYDENEQQFNNEAQLNYWVGNKTIQYLRDNKDSAILNQDKVIFLLHFLGPDTAGHNFKPHSKEYGDNIEAVDGIVKAMVHTLSSYYNHDNKTAFIYSSDHGMTDWGSHGDGSDHETETPFVAWGAGVGCTPYPPSSPSSFLPSSSGHLDIAQVDMVSLVSTILGIPIPVHSVGELPLQYLSLDTSQQARVMHSNAIQIHNAYRTLRSQRRESIARCLFTPFHKLDEQEEAVQLGRIELGFKLGDHQMVISQCKDLIRLSLEGLSYFHTYHQTTLLSCVSLAYLFIIRTLFLSVAQRTKISELTIRLTYR